ncbi:hypothetical protein GCM10023185_45860 [Hymenobacter saemangeumensis]|uniref:Uncharacterized protein n=1 Tax=Hymenobacter saemangeumensis TaxID=1084522 RepID=A0ABP8ISS9_9BACT
MLASVFQQLGRGSAVGKGGQVGAGYHRSGWLGRRLGRLGLRLAAAGRAQAHSAQKGKDKTHKADRKKAIAQEQSRLQTYGEGLLMARVATMAG